MATFTVSCPSILRRITNHLSSTNKPPAILLFNESERKTAEDVVHRMVKRAVEMEGTVTGEHGVGLIKRDYLNHELSESTVDAMRRVSSALPLLCCYSQYRVSVLTSDANLVETSLRSVESAQLRQGRPSREAEAR
jgi:hypothetical protein